jgi:PAS domain S-box-containing protein
MGGNHQDPLESPTILIVEDSRVQAAMLRRLLERNSYCVRVVNSVKEAFEDLKNLRSDLIVSDVVMPETSGFEFARQLKADGKLSTIPVILLTGLSDTDDIFRGLASGADYYITKPYDNAYLVAKVGSILSRRSGTTNEPDAMVEFESPVEGESRPIKSTVRRLIDLLVCSYENSSQINHNLIKARENLLALNQELEAKVNERTADLRSEIEQRKETELKLQQAHDELEARVRERTEELATANKDLQKEIRHRKAAERSIKNSEAKYRLLVDKAPVGILYVDRLGNIIEFNPRFQELLGAPLAQAIAGLDALKAPAFTESGISALLNTAMDSGKIASAEATFNQAGGVERFYSIVVTPVRRSDGAVYGAQALIEDVSERKRAEQIKLETERARSLSEMGELVAHNFNNILQTVIGGAQLALTNFELGNSEDIHGSLEDILDSALTGAETVKRLRYLVRFEQKPSVDYNPLDLSLEAHKAIEMSRIWWRTAPRKLGVKITVDRHLEPGCFVKANHNEIFSLAVTLIRKATEELRNGGRITISTFHSEDQVTLEVMTDWALTTIGSPQGVSESFWRTALDFCRPAVKAQAGEIFLDNLTGHGSKVTVRFPLCPSMAEQAQTPTDRDLGPGLRILLVDDSPPVLRVLRDGLLLYGHDVSAVLSGKKALDLFRLKPFDAVVCDMGLPDMNGWKIGREIKLLCEKRGVEKSPFVLITAWPGNHREEKELIESGVDRIVEKPVSAEKLLEIIDEIRKDPGRTIEA